MIGAPLDTITLLHHAEHLANIPEKRVRRYRRRMPSEDGPVWVDFEEFDTCDPVASYLPDNVFERIAQDHLAAGFGREGRIGRAVSYLFDAAELVRFGVDWLERDASSAPYSSA
jgi:aminoglycoside 3-N-acetyltransferase